MASNRIVLRAAARAVSTAPTLTSSFSTRVPRTSPWRVTTSILGQPSQLQQPHRRHLTTSTKPSTIYDFSATQTLSSSPSPSKMLIDVREPHEYSEGHIPNAVNLPIQTSPDALFLPADDFQDKFGVPKPEAGTEVVFYCKAGVRSKAAAELARQLGYREVSEYPGSWLDWVKNGGEVSK